MASEENKTLKPLACLERPGYGDRKAEQLRVDLNEYAGKPYVSVRIWYQENGQWLPTKKGCSVRMGEIEGVIAALSGALPQDGQPQPRKPPAKAKPVAKDELFEGEGTKAEDNLPF